ncbi:MAG: choice-of-anchor H family protein, partial [Bacteroidota bacterium]
TIKNTGMGTLNLTGNPRVTVSDTTNFSVPSQPSSPVSVNNSTTFQIKFDPTSTGTKTATVSIASNDSDEGTYDFRIQGVGTVQTVAIVDAWIKNGTWVDIDGNGYASALSLEWDAKVDYGTLSVYANLRADDIVHLERDLGNTGNYTLTTNNTRQSFVVPVAASDLSHTTWDFQIDLYKAGTTERVARLGMGADPQLNDVKVELPSEDGGQVTQLSWHSGNQTSSPVITSISAGQTVYLRVDAPGMNNETVDVEIWERDIGLTNLDDRIAVKAVTINNGVGFVAWTASWQGDDGASPLNKYYIYYDRPWSTDNLYSARDGDLSVSVGTSLGLELKNPVTWDWDWNDEIEDPKKSIDVSLTRIDGGVEIDSEMPTWIVVHGRTDASRYD